MTTISTEELAAVHSSAHNKTIDCLETLLNEIVSKRSIQVCGLVRENNSLHARISELSALQKENAELKEKNVAWALGVEQSNTDIVDMQRDEFMRIKALLHASESPSDREIIGICNRAIACIEQTVPVVVQRDNLEKEVASLRTQNRELREACRVKDEALQSVIDSCVHPDVAIRAVMITLEPIRKALALQPEK